MRSFVKMMFPVFVETYVAEWRHDLGMRTKMESGSMFRNFPSALYATDVTFHRSNKPVGSLHDKKAYYYIKHKLYGYKM